MKNLFLLLVIILTFSACDKDDKPIAEIDKLPPATQTGTNKIGCLVNGQALLPKGVGINYNCFYQHLADGKHFVLGYNNSTNDILKNIVIGIHLTELNQGQTYQLTEDFGSNLISKYGAYSISTNQGGILYNTNNLNVGELKITKLDPVNLIISGTFWFDAINHTGEKIQIRDGRFDMIYSL